MDPITIGLLVAGGLQVANGFQQAEAIRNQSQIRSQINELNSKYLELDAFEAEQFGFTQTARYQSVVDKVLGDQVTNLAAANVDTTFGTAAAVQQETRLTGFLNALDFQRAAQQKAKGLRLQASNARLGNSFQEFEAESQANTAEFTGIVGGLTTGISGFARGKN